MIRNKKGLLTEMIILVVIGIIIFVFFVAWKYGFNLITDSLGNIASSTSVVYDTGGNPHNYTMNISEASTNTFGYVNTGLNQLELIGYMIFFSYIFATFIIAYFSRQHPIMFFVYFLATVVLVVFSVHVSNVYEGLLTNDVIGADLSSYTVGNYLMSNLPYLVVIVGFVGIILGLVGLMRGGEYG